MKLENYKKQIIEWPTSGQHIMAQYDDSSVIVYQAYNLSIADYAVKHQRFGGDFSFSRMSWIKPNFLWMMFRAGWATKEGQERILAVSINRDFFEQILATAVASSFQASTHGDKEQWQKAVENSDVRLQWDPDHDPFGKPVQRRAVQLGLRGKSLVEYGTTAVISIKDITDFVRAQHANAVGDCGELVIPRERVYVPKESAARNVGINTFEEKLTQIE